MRKAHSRTQLEKRKWKKVHHEKRGIETDGEKRDQKNQASNHVRNPGSSSVCFILTVRVTLLGGMCVNVGKT